MTDLCSSTTRLNSPLAGTISLTASPLQVLTNTEVTSLMNTIVDIHTVIVATTSSGRIVKVSFHVAFRIILMTYALCRVIILVLTSVHFSLLKNQNNICKVLRYQTDAMKRAHNTVSRYGTKYRIYMWPQK